LDGSRFPDDLLLRKIPFFSFVRGGAVGLLLLDLLLLLTTSDSTFTFSTLLPTTGITCKKFKSRSELHSETLIAI
jgi:hypothetical protein